MRIFIYSRYSSMDQNGRSIDDEVRICQKYIGNHGVICDMHKFWQKAQERWQELKTLRLMTFQSIKKRESDLRFNYYLNGCYWPTCTGLWPLEGTAFTRYWLSVLIHF
jgi:hypothetical protein